MTKWTAPNGGQLNVQCRALTSVIVSFLPAVVPAAPLPVPRLRDADGYGPHLLVSISGTSATGSYRFTIGTDPGTYRVRAGWAASVFGGAVGEEFETRSLEFAEEVPYTQRFLLTRLAPADGLIESPTFTGEVSPAPYTFVRVLRGAVLDEVGLPVPLNVDLPLGVWYWAPRESLYQYGIEV